MIIDFGHLLTNPIYQKSRYSIYFHPLHSYYAIEIYMALAFFKRPLNIIGIGLLLHMLTDYSNCFI